MPFILLAVGLLVGMASQPNEETLHYRIRPIPKADRTELEITCRFKPNDKRPQTIAFPADSYGTPDLHRYVTSFEGERGTVIKAGKEATERVVEAGDDGEVRVKYVLSYDPNVMDGISFGPNVGPYHFYGAGCQWMLQIGDLTAERNHVIEVVNVPRGWHAYSSIGPDATRLAVKASYEGMIETSIGVGQREFDQFMVRSKPVAVYVEGEFAIPRADIVAAVKRIVTLEREWFADFDHPFYVVTILPRSGIIAGTCIPNQFVCFAKPDITRDELNILIAHEMFHTWLPNKAAISLAKGESDLRHEWFYEGFTDYFARRILADAGLLSSQKFADLVNQDINNLADNPGRTNSLADLIAVQKAGKFETAYKKLAYYRGALIALTWDATIRRAGKGKTLADFIRDYYRVAAKGNGKITEHAFFELASSYGIDAKGDLDRFIIRGEAITVPPDALGDQFVLRDARVPAFDPGFSIRDSYRSGKIAGVVAQGPADRAGLKNGMQLVRMRNSNRFGNGWRAHEPLVVTVRIDGHEQKFDYMPHGLPLVVKHFVGPAGQ